MAMQPAAFPLVGCEPVDVSMQPSHGTLVYDGASLDGREFQRGDPVVVVDNGSNEDPSESIRALNLRNSQCMLVPLRAVCWVPTHSEQRSGATFLLTVYGPTLDFRHAGEAQPRFGSRGVATLLGSSIYVAREVVMESSPSRIVLDTADRVSMFTIQWDALSIDVMQQPALTPSSSCASSRSPSESGDDMPVMHFYRHQGRRDSAIEIRDPESPVYKSPRGRKSTSPKPQFNRSAFFATKHNTPISTASPLSRQSSSRGTSWSESGSEDGFGLDYDCSLSFDVGFPESLDLCTQDLQMPCMDTNGDLEINFMFVPQDGGEGFGSGQQEVQRQDNNTQGQMWATAGLQTGPSNSWNTMQVQQQQAPDLRQPQMPVPPRQQLPARPEAQPEYYGQYRLMEDPARSQVQAGSLTHTEPPDAPNMPSGQRAEFMSSQQLPVSTTPHPAQTFQMQPRFPEHPGRLPVPHAASGPFPVPQEVHVIHSSRHDPRPPYSLPSSSSYIPVHEGTLPSSHGQQPRRSPLPEESRSSSARGTPVMSRQPKPQPAHTFTPTALVSSFQQGIQAQVTALERHCEQVQQDGDDELLRKFQEVLQAARRASEEAGQVLGRLQPISGIPFQGTERRLQSLADQIVAAAQSLTPDAPIQAASSDEGIQQLNQKVQSLKDFIEYVEGVHPEVVNRVQDSAAPGSVNNGKTRQGSSQALAVTAPRVPSAPASVSSQVVSNDESDSCRWVDGQATPPPDRSAMAQNRDHSRLFRDMANGPGRSRQDPRVASTSEFYPAYSRPSSHMNSPVTSHPAPAEPAGLAFFQQPLPTPIQQAIPLSEYAMQSRPIQTYTPPTSAEMMRPMQPVPSVPSQHYTTQQESPFCLRPPQQDCMYPSSGPEMSAGYAPRSPVGFHPTNGPAPPSGYYHDARSGLPERRTVRQERPAPYQLNYRDQRRRRGSQ
ncbi:hypothetical protein C8035_v009567 [Colletotrichum spinosum]|uniref:Uncharacterized protein n=1 Tax=Colletotrichum spinosum TaxID=1347390 RepID=A0A4R8Q6U8_9PEZI|nr:hypothetical protein C8035_v009567 [Colletotrichum spinosum]